MNENIEQNSAESAVTLDKIVSHEVCERAIRHYGIKEQAGQAMEECGELIAAIHKYFFRSGLDMQPIHLAEEIADVRIMCEQLSVILEQQGYSEIVEHVRLCKLKRLSENISRDIFATERQT